MKKTDIPKYVSIFITLCALTLLLLGYRQLAAFLVIPPIVALFISTSKSGDLFVIAILFALIVNGLATDYPIKGFPPALVFIPFFGLTMTIRSVLFNQMGMSIWPGMERLLLLTGAAGFAVAAYLKGYAWDQWLSGGLIAGVFAMFAFVIHGDRAEATKLSKEVKVNPGSSAPDFTLPDQHGNSVSLQSILKEQHALLIFVRGDWCPTCHMMLRGYMKNKDAFAQKNVRVIGIGPDPQGVNKDIMGRIDPNALMLSDLEQDTAARYSGTLQKNNPGTKNLYKNGIPLPASFLVHMNGKIIFTSRSDRPAEILQPEDITVALNKI